VLSFLLELLNFVRKLGHDILPLFRKFRQRFQIVRIPSQFRIQLNILLQAAPFLQNSLRFFLIIPELRLSYLFFKLENLCALPLRIKDTLESAVSFPRSRSLSHEVPRAFIPPKLIVYELKRLCRPAPITNPHEMIAQSKTKTSP
jgi:hypothetical protein